MDAPVEQIFDNPYRNLAATVLKAAAKDNDVDSTMITFWCDIVGVTPSVFRDRVKQEGGITWRS